MGDSKVLRNSKGQFEKGTAPPNRKGRPSSTKEYYNALAKLVTPTKWRKICRRAIEDAIAGDRYARKWIGEYLMGKPTTNVDLLLIDLAETGMTLDQWLETAAGRRYEAVNE